MNNNLVTQDQTKTKLTIRFVKYHRYGLEVENTRLFVLRRIYIPKNIYELLLDAVLERISLLKATHPDIVDIQKRVVYGENTYVVATDVSIVDNGKKYTLLTICEYGKYYYSGTDLVCYVFHNIILPDTYTKAKQILQNKLHGQLRYMFTTLFNLIEATARTYDHCREVQSIDVFVEERNTTINIDKIECNLEVTYDEDGDPLKNIEIDVTAFSIFEQLGIGKTRQYIIHTAYGETILIKIIEIPIKKLVDTFLNIIKEKR